MTMIRKQIGGQLAGDLRRKVHLTMARAIILWIMLLALPAWAEGINAGQVVGIDGINNARAAAPSPPTVTGVSPNSEPTTCGIAVTISGTNFTGATVVDFGAGNPATFSVTNSTTISVPSCPSGSAGTVDVTVTTPGGTSATSSADHFTYTAVACASYTGPADVTGFTSPVAWNGIWAYKASYCGSKFANVCVSGTCADMLTSATTGGPVSQTINGTVCPNSSTSACQVANLYDQTIGGNCSGSCDLLQATAGERPVLTTTCATGASVCLLMPSSGTPYLLAAGNMTLTQPYSVILPGVGTTIGSSAPMIGLNGANNFLSFLSTSQVQFSCGSTNTFSVTATAWNDYEVICAAAASTNDFLYINGNLKNTTTGTGSFTDAPIYLYANGDAGVSGIEVGFYASDLHLIVSNYHSNVCARVGYTC
jgi:hypothetical protein